MKLTIAHSVWWPVVIEVPADGGLVKRLEVEGHFRLYADEDYATAFTRPAGELLDEALIGWRGIEDESGEALMFSPESLAQLKRIRWAINGFVQGFINAHNGAGRKN